MRSLALLPLVFAACSSNGAPPPGGSDGGTIGTSNAQFSLAASSVQYVSTIQGSRPMTGRRFLTLTATVANSGEQRPLSVAAPLFSVLTKAGLSVGASGDSGLLAQPCAGDLSVAVGGMLSCSLAFEIPLADSPLTLVYDDTMRRAQTDLTALLPQPPDGGSACASVNPQATGCAPCVQQNCNAELGALFNNNTCLNQMSCVDKAVQAGQCADACSPCAMCPIDTMCTDLIATFRTCVATSCAQMCSG
jgi:hypothetical protein